MIHLGGDRRLYEQESKFRLSHPANRQVGFARIGELEICQIDALGRGPDGSATNDRLNQGRNDATARVQKVFSLSATLYT